MSLGNSLVAQAPTIEGWQKDDPNYLLVGKNLTEAQINAIKTNGTPLVRTITAYSSTPDQTDDTPFITAYNTEVRDGIVASNEFPKGTRLLIDGKEYVVEDKTNSRYKYLIDIWMPTRKDAKLFGRQIKEVILLDQ